MDVLINKFMRADSSQSIILKDYTSFIVLIIGVTQLKRWSFFLHGNLTLKLANKRLVF